MSFPQPESLVVLEQQIAAIPYDLGADGTHWDGARGMASVLSMDVSTDIGNTTCGSLGHDIERTAAFFCPSVENWNTVFVTPAGVDRQSDPRFLDNMRHELAHKFIYMQCFAAFDRGLTQWNNEMGEGVTNSYAVLFLGADRERLGGGPAEYQMSDVTDAKAQAIHDGDLACFDDSQLPVD
jgi:hypothetical protein